MHIHEAYTTLITWLETPVGLTSLAHYVRRRRNLDEAKGCDKAMQIRDDLLADKLCLRDLRLLAAFCVDQLPGLVFQCTKDPMQAFPVRDAVVRAAGGLGKVPHETEMWTPEQRARFRARYGNHMAVA